VLEMKATAEGISHRLLMPPAYAGVILSALRAVLPAVTATPDERYEPMWPTMAAGLGLSNHRRPLGVERSADVSAAILSALQPLGTSEQVMVQWVLAPMGPVAPVRAA